MVNINLRRGKSPEKTVIVCRAKKKAA